MLKSTFSFASLALLLSFTTSQAQTTPATPPAPMTMPMTMTCSEDDMKKMQTTMNGMTDAAKKDMAMKEMTMARDMMGQKKNDACVMHMNNAQKAMQ